MQHLFLETLALSVFQGIYKMGQQILNLINWIKMNILYEYLILQQVHHCLFRCS